MDTVTSVNFLKEIIKNGSASINNFLYDINDIKSEAKLNEIFEGAIKLSNTGPQEKKLKYKILRYLTHRRNNMYWFYLKHMFQARDRNILTYDQYQRQLINQQLLKSKPKSFLDKVSQLFTADPPNLNYGSFDPLKKEIMKIKEHFYSSNLPSSTMAKIEAWMNYTKQQQIQDLMNESSKMLMISEDENKLEEIIIETEENSLHSD